MRDLLTLYKLLWEQVELQETINAPLWVYIINMRDEKILSEDEKKLLVNNISITYSFELDKKEFVQRRIKELENNNL